jgi:hypothetical protein
MILKVSLMHVPFDWSMVILVHKLCDLIVGRVEGDMDSVKITVPANEAVIFECCYLASITFMKLKVLNTRKDIRK